MKNRLRKAVLGGVSLSMAALAGCTGDESSQQQTANTVTVTKEFNNSGETTTSTETTTQATSSGDVEVGPRTGDSPPSDSPGSDIRRISFSGMRLFVHVLEDGDVDAIAVVSPVGSRLALEAIGDGDESAEFNLETQTHGILYPAGNYRIHGYKQTGTEPEASYEHLESHSVTLEPDLSIAGVNNVGIAGKVRLEITNDGTAPYPVSEYRVGKWWRTPGRDSWAEPTEGPVIVQPKQRVSLIVDTKTARRVDRSASYEKLQNEYCNGEQKKRNFEFRSSRLMTHREHTSRSLRLEGEAVKQETEGGATVECNQIRTEDDQ
jgi:hypothetical protein